MGHPRRVAAIAAAALVGGCAVGAGAADERGAEVLRFKLDSEAVGRKLPVSVVIPAGGGEGRPLLVFLHGRGGTSRSHLGDPLYAALQSLGDRAPVVVLPDGGDSSYWHDRDSGDWERYVVDEVIGEAVERSGADGERVAIGGISMGGFGAFDLVRRHPKRFCAAGGHSPALWTSAAQTAPGAFDDAADFSRHNVVRAARRGAKGLVKTPLWLDAGDADPFQPGIRAFRAALRSHDARLTARTYPGGHTGDYWNAHLKRYLRFYARKLAAC